MASPPRRAYYSDVSERYRVLLDIGHTLTGTLSPEQLYRVIYLETARILEAAGFYIALYDADRDSATVVFYADRGHERRVEISYRGSDSEVIRSARGTIIDDRVHAHSLLVLGDENTDITRSAISAPLRYKGRVIGAVSCQSYEPAAYRDEDLELLQGIADMAAVAIENARFVSELEARRLEAERIEEIGLALTSSLDAKDVIDKVVAAALELLRADSAAVWLIEGRARARVAASRGPYAAPEGTEWAVAEDMTERLSSLDRPVIVSDDTHRDLLPEALRRPGARAMVAPLAIGDQGTGALAVGRHEAGLFTEEEVHITRRLASQASVALANARLHERLQSLSLTDPLTGLPNRRHLEMHLQRELAAARRGRDLTVVIFDLDRFKQYNDTYGHVAGDEALRQVGRVLTREARAMNVVARYGGDEFVSVLAGSDEQEALQHARRIAEAVAVDPHLARTGMTLSYGVAQHDRTMTTIDDIIRMADQALYQSKSRRGSARTTGHA
jgi:diguanylate cyclase (GGDEF)-like protein